MYSWLQNLLTSQRKTQFQGGLCTRAKFSVLRWVDPKAEFLRGWLVNHIQLIHLYQEVSVSPTSALCACQGFKVGAAQSLQLGFVLCARI